MSDKKETITEKQKKEALESSLFQLTTEQSEYAGILQEIGIIYDSKCPSASMEFNKKDNQYIMRLNPQFFCKMSLLERTAILTHEVLHFTHGHLFRYPKEEVEKDIMLWLISADMAINQYINNMPKGSIDVKNFKDASNNPFPLQKPMELYYELLKDLKKKAPEKLKQYLNLGESKDDHPWQEMSEDEKAKAMIAARQVVERTMEKSSFGFDKSTDFFKDLLQYIEANLNPLNYKKILQQAIKKSASSIDRKYSWNRRNKRYAEMAPGTKVGDSPRLDIISDSSGSISIKEYNEFMKVIDGFLKVGTRDCYLSFFHTRVYKTMKYKKGRKLAEDILESGGTDINPVFEHINKSKCDLMIILTDGYFDKASVKLQKPTDIIWVISKNGTKDHPMKHIGKTILLKGVLE